jgi:NADH-ubiquinone oxidoreductase chain 4
MLQYLFITPIIGIIILFFINNEIKIKQITIITTIITFIISLFIYINFNPIIISYQFVENYISFGFLQFQFGIDGISLYFLILTTFLTPIMILAS